MARKAAKKTPRKASAGKASGAAADLPQHIIDTAFALAVQRGWRDLSLAEIAEAAGVPLTRLYALFPSKQAILNGFSDRVDAAMLAEGVEGLETPARDRLFDVVMRRLDALQPHKEALGIIHQDQFRDPLAACCGLTRLRRSMVLTLEAAGFSTTGLRGILRVKGLAAIYLATLRIWLRDDSEDMARTMAYLDGQLARVDGLIGRLKSMRRRRATA